MSTGSSKEYLYVPGIGDMASDDAVKLITEYNKYIQEATEDNRYHEGWYPVSISEFYFNEMEGKVIDINI